MKYKCVNCVYEGKLSVPPLNHCPICGDNTVEINDPVSEIIVEEKVIPVIDIEEPKPEPKPIKKSSSRKGRK